jgi:signal transduction histidine kinase
VQDWGIGILPADQTQLFERFHRGQNVEEIPGTGLGLAIVKQCVDLHQGQIQIQSQPQQGTTVFVTLPNQLTLPNQVTLPNQAPSQPAQEMLGQPEITQPDKVEE